MKYTLSILFLFTCSLVFAQKAKLVIEVKNFSNGTISVRDADQYFLFNSFNNWSKSLDIIDGKASIALDVNTPKFIAVGFNARDRSFKQNFYLSPGDDLKYVLDFSDLPKSEVCIGKGSNNNQNLSRFTLDFELSDLFKKDTLPTRVVSFLQTKKSILETELLNYVKKYRPAESFVTNYRKEIKYKIADAFFTYKAERKYNITEKAYSRNQEAWDAAQDEFFTISDLNKDHLVNSMPFRNLICNYLLRTKEELWTKADQNSFFSYWYGDIASGKKRYKEDQQNDLQKRIADRFFTGKTLELAYAIILNEGLYEQKIENLDVIYEDLTRKFPNSRYISQFSSKMKEVANRFNRALKDNAIFVQTEGKDYQSFKDILNLVKGKTVLLDMWGTWCGPCRQEIEKNADAIKKEYQNKGLSYLYIVYSKL